MKRLIATIIILLITRTGYSQSVPRPQGDHAHPINFRKTKAEVLGGILRFEYKWDSSSGDTNDLNEVWVGEHVTCPNHGILKQPPWKNNVPDPTITPSRSDNNGPNGGLVDTHYPPGTITYPVLILTFPEGYTEDSVTTTQNYGYHCRKCSAAPPDNSLSWQVSLYPTISITRRVYVSGTGWHYQVTKEGLTAEVSINQ